MLEKLTAAVDRLAAEAVEKQINRLAQTQPPPGVTVEATDVGLILTGKNLRRRMLNDPNLRNFGR